MGANALDGAVISLELGQGHPIANAWWEAYALGQYDICQAIYEDFEKNF